MPTDRRTGSSRSRTILRFRILSIISLVTVSITAFAGFAQAAPATAGPVKYQLTRTANSLSLTVDNGRIAIENNLLTIRNLAGAEVFTMPLAYRKEYRQFPIDAHTAGTTATLTPSRDLARSTAVDRGVVDSLRVKAATIVGPQTRQQRDDQALARFNQQLSTGLTISSIVGTAIGAIVGGILGCVIATATTVIGCVLGGFVLGASVGGIIGLMLGGGGSLVGAAIQYFQTINSPFRPQIVP
ncbi:glycine zipper family protein [Gordonia sp. NPDC003424]